MANVTGAAGHASAVRRLDAAVQAAEAAARSYARSSAAQRCRLLELIAQQLDAERDAIAMAAQEELGSCASTSAGQHLTIQQQLHAFCAVLRGPGWQDGGLYGGLDAAFSEGQAQQRARHVPLGPVAILGGACHAPIYASAGADVIAALAAGCPVVVHARDTGPLCQALVAQAVRRAVRAAGMQEGIYSLVTSGADILLAHPHIRAAAYCGSRAGTLRLMRRSLERSEPIPVLAETTGCNPVFILPGALNARAEHLGQQLVRQFHPGLAGSPYRPGMLVAIEGDGYIDLRETIIEGIAALPPVAMPDRGARLGHASSVGRLLGQDQVDLLAEGALAAGRHDARAMFAEIDADALLAASTMLADERPGPAGLLVRCRDSAAMLAVAARLGRQTMAALHMDDGADACANANGGDGGSSGDRIGGDRDTHSDIALALLLMPQLERMARHVCVNSFTTLPVCRGAAAAQAIYRFLRPVYYQDVPPSLLPAAWQDSEPPQRQHQQTAQRSAGGVMRH